MQEPAGTWSSLGEDSDPPDLGEAADPFADPPDLGEAADPFAESPAWGEAPDPFATSAPVGSQATSAALSSETFGFSADALDPRGDPPGFEIHGRANVTAAFTRSGESVDLLQNNSLDLSSVDVYVQWFPVHWFGALLEVELDSDLDGGDRTVEVELELGVLEWRPLGDARLRLRAGRSPVPFGLERRHYAPGRNELANRPAAFLRVFPGTYSDSGAFLWLNWPLGSNGGNLELEAALTKGLEGLTREDRPDAFRKDDNDEAQFTGRIGLTLFEVEPTPGLSVRVPARLTIGASALFGHYDEEARRRIQFFGFDVELRLAGFRLRAEMIRSQIERANAQSSSQEGVGVYVLVAYHWYPDVFGAEELFLAFRYGRADPDDNVRAPEDVETYHLGGGWSPYHGLLLKTGIQIGFGSQQTERIVFLELGYSF
ncbi:MAG: hypothetical protein JKY65_29860 [Planctomycetes bacterium]|nr:hypothetical protein [Planctomycetota bacterium]